MHYTRKPQIVRAARFAAAIRRRCGLGRPAPVPCRRTVGEPPLADLVFQHLRGVRERHHWHIATGRRWKLSVGLELTLTTKPPAGGGRPALRSGGPFAQPGPLPAAPAPMTQLAVWSIPTVPDGAGGRSAVLAGPPAVQVGSAPSRVKPRDGASSRLPATLPPSSLGVLPVDMVHRSPSPTPPAPRMDPTAPGLSVRWADSPGRTPATAASSAAPMTLADLPGVVDRVVTELDRRVASARERKGWTA